MSKKKRNSLSSSNPFSNEQMLTHYYDILQNKKLPLFHYLKSFSLEPFLTEARFSSLRNLSLKTLRDIHTKAQSLFYEKIINTSHPSPLEDTKPLSVSYLDLKIILAEKYSSPCILCENRCAVNRLIGEKGKCGIDNNIYLSSFFLHRGEERPLVPSGTLFFAGCNFECVFCQNYDISRAGKDFRIERMGVSLTSQDLAQKASSLCKKGARNINYVGGDPGPYLFSILESLKFQTHSCPQLWNSNFYQTREALELLLDVFDIWLPDFKYGNNSCAERYSKVESYWEVLTRNLKMIYEKGTKSIIIRHLIMPGHIECCSFPILDWIAKNIPNVLVNIMAQYYPSNLVSSQSYPEINRRITNEEFYQVIDYADSLGIHYQNL